MYLNQSFVLKMSFVSSVVVDREARTAKRLVGAGDRLVRRKRFVVLQAIS